MYKILLAGGNSHLIDEFFTADGNPFEIMTTSIRYQDVAAHIKYFQPDMLVYCLSNESRDVFSRILSIKGKWFKLPFALILSKDDCEEWTETAGTPADMVFQTPVRLVEVMHEIREYLDARHPAEIEKPSAKEQPDRQAQPGSGEQQSRQTQPGSGEQQSRQAQPGREEQQSRQVQPGREEQPGRQTRPEAYGQRAVAAEQKRTHILVVDDDVTMLKTIKGHLEGQFDVATAPSGRVALKFLESKTTDLILLDYAMPEESGVEVLEKLRANPVTKNIPVVFLIGITEQHMIKKAIAMKPQGYLLKPIDHEKLLSAITNILKQYHK